jgi:hypothetical protein
LLGPFLVRASIEAVKEAAFKKPKKRKAGKKR